jgi:hypothetical protein
MVEYTNYILGNYINKLRDIKGKILTVIQYQDILGNDYKIIY